MDNIHKLKEGGEFMATEFSGEGISLNNSVRPAYGSLALIVITVLYFYSDGWATLTKSFMIVTIISVIFTVWFPYSPFVKVTLIAKGDVLQVGKKMMEADEIEKIVCEAYGLVVKFHLGQEKESLDLRMENDEQRKTRDFLQTWAKQHGVYFIEEKIDH